MNKVKRYLCIVLVMAFVLSFATAVSASTVQWEIDGERYTASATRTVQGGSLAIFSGTKKYHTNGTATVLIAASNYSVAKSLRWSTTPQYQWQVKQAISGEGLLTSTTFTVNSGYRITVPAIEPSGEYVIAAFYYTYNGNWTVFKQSETSSIRLESGYFYDAPLITEFYYDHYKVS